MYVKSSCYVSTPCYVLFIFNGRLAQYNIIHFLWLKEKLCQLSSITFSGDGSFCKEKESIINPLDVLSRSAVIMVTSAES